MMIISRFNAVDLNLEGKCRPGRPTKLDNEDLIAALEDELSSATCELTDELDVSHTKAPPPAAKTQSAQKKQGVEKKKEEDKESLDQALLNDGENVLAKPITTWRWPRSGSTWSTMLVASIKYQALSAVPHQNQFGKKVIIYVC
ncbi:hypothetical protein KIN20_022065 [Parelaphostrongylus tenuis]|uniref:Uncharacterized protein n=1 Tax=Parelaphostrongylus tenuis TaxID=148309 RepID=A0AAD5N599_PARTN|nr:hypothetical protein KIN20_022065 [Parelaphostrongylus tenuis]